MNSELLNPEPLIAALANQGVDFVLIGGLAVIAHGGNRFTRDVDLAIAHNRDNARAIAKALSPFEPKPVGFPEGLPFVWDEQTVFSSSTLTLSTSQGRIDLLCEPEGIEGYASLKKNASLATFHGLEVLVASVADLIAMKNAVGRTQDIAHIAELQTIEKLDKETPP